MNTNDNGEYELRLLPKDGGASAGLLLKLLPAVDDLERALASVTPDVAATPWYGGFKLIPQKLQTVLESEGVTPILTPYRTPQANAHAERFVRTARTESLDWMLILGARQLDQVLRVFVEHYNGERPHRALGRCPPAPPPDPYGRRRRSRRSTEEIDSVALCTSTTGPRLDKQSFGTLHDVNSSPSYASTSSITTASAHTVGTP